MSQPDPKANNLLKRINLLATGESEQGSFALRKLEHEAKSLIKFDATNAYAALGAIACIKRDRQGVKTYYAKALNLAPGDLSILSNYSISLFKLCLFNESRQCAEKAYEISQRSDLDLLQILIESSVLTGDLGESIKWLIDWDRKSPNQRYPIQLDITMANTILRKNHVTDSDAGRFLKAAYAILGQKGFDVSEVTFRAFDDEVLYQIEVYADVDQTVDLNFELADTLVEMDLVPSVSCAMTVMYIPIMVN